MRTTGVKRAEKRNKNLNGKAVLITTASVLVAALVISAALLLTGGSSADTVRVMDFGTVVEGVSVNGINISGMTRQQAYEATGSVDEQVLGAVKITLDISGQIYEFGAQELGVGTDYREVMTRAMDYGHTGDFEQRRQAAETAISEGAVFTVSLIADRDSIAAAMAGLKSQLDKEPREASVQFTPRGHTADGMEYKPELRDIISMVKNFANGKTYERPELERIPAEEMPIAARYLYYDNHDKFVNNYKPADADVSRFIYTSEQTGIIVDTAVAVDGIAAQIKSGSYSPITVPVQITEPEVTLEYLKTNTALISSWTSSFAKSSHYNYNRNYNVAMMSSLLTGSVLMPGVEWTINKTAGPRNGDTAKTYGWRKAAGIENGGYTAQYGGGVCQLGSTTYNAAIRSGLRVVKSRHHSIPSDYIPLGLDATLGGGDLDLILINDGTMPYYIVSFVNPKEKNVTVEIYGPPLVDKEHPEWGNVIYNYTNKYLGRFGTPAEKNYYGYTQAPDDYQLSPEHPSHIYANGRKGTKVRVYRHVYSLTGEELCDPIEFEYHEYPVINQIIYHYYAEGEEPSASPTGGEGEET